MKKLYNYCNNVVNKSKMFFRKEKTVNNYTIELYSHRFFDYEFYKTMDIQQAKELRGIVFIKKNNKIIDMFYSIPKFFAINQQPEYNLDVIGNEKILEVTEKADGSLITTYIVNNTVYYKTKNSFDNSLLDTLHTEIDLYNYNNFILDMNSKGYVCMFEYISPNNKIVIKYNEPKLLLTKIRNKHNGKFIPLDYVIDSIKKYNISYVDYFIQNIDINSFVDKINNDTAFLPFYNKFNQEKFEGFVILTDKGNLYKIKTRWYYLHHHIYDFVIMPERKKKLYLFKAVINNTVDDLPKEVIQENHDFIQNISNKVYKEYNKLLNLLKVYSVDKRPIKIIAQELNTTYPLYAYIVFKNMRCELSENEIYQMYIFILNKKAELALKLFEGGKINE